MAETGVIAHSKNYTENLSIFWDSFYHFVDKTLILTTLKRDNFPLINYDTEDIVELNSKSKYLLNLIQGRSKDIFFLKQKNSKKCYEISGIFFVHVLKNIQGILSVYLKQITDEKIEIKILSKVITSEKTIKDLFIKNSKKDFPQIDPDSINIILIEESILTKSGKELYNLNYLDVLINIIKRAIFVIREAWLAPRAKRNRLINRNFFFEARDRLNNKRGVKNYLKNHSAISKLKVTKKWHYNKNKSEFQLNYKSSIFGNGVIRIKKNHSKKVLIFLHGYYSSSENVLSKKNDPQNISNYCFKENIDLAAWTFPLHGQRGENSIYLNLKSNVTNEREYSRFLGMYNSSIWLEYLNEIEFCINEIKKYYKNKVEVYIVGWSMELHLYHMYNIYFQR